MNTVKYFVDDQGSYLGAFEGALPPAGAIEVATPPNHGLDTWSGSGWDDYIPVLTPLEIRNAALADITYVRPSDGAQIQIRHPDYASDYIIMTSAINMLAPLETRLWIVKDDQPTLVSREDLEAALAFGSAEVDRIFVEYITALQGG